MCHGPSFLQSVGSWISSTEQLLILEFVEASALCRSSVLRKPSMSHAMRHACVLQLWHQSRP